MKSTTDQDSIQLPAINLEAKLAAKRQRQELARQAFNGENSANRLTICVDISGSMSTYFRDTTRIQAAATAIRHLMSASNPSETSYALVEFHSYASIGIQRTTNYTAFHTHDFQPTGGTDFTNALQFALQTNPSRIIFLSDGEASRPDHEVNLCHDRGVKIDTIFIGNPGDDYGYGGEELLKWMSEMTGGVFKRCDDPTKLTEHFVMLEPKNYLQLEHK
jgi:uncharacterized protein with von Willebrand factor type A (vWA) domain